MEVIDDDQTSGSGDDSGGEIRADSGEIDDVTPTGGQAEEKPNCPPVGKPSNPRQSRAKKNVIQFKLPTGGQKKARGGKQKTSPTLPTGGQEVETEWLKGLLPTAKTGDWWETPVDDKGFKIKYRWRVGNRKEAYVFRRLGKRQIQTLKEQSYERQVWLIADRIFGELRAEGRTDIAARLSPRPLLDRVAGAEN